MPDGTKPKASVERAITFSTQGQAAVHQKRLTTAGRYQGELQRAEVRGVHVNVHIHVLHEANI